MSEYTPERDLMHAVTGDGEYDLSAHAENEIGRPSSASAVLDRLRAFGARLGVYASAADSPRDGDELSEELLEADSGETFFGVDREEAGKVFRNQYEYAQDEHDA